MEGYPLVQCGTPGRAVEFSRERFYLYWLNQPLVRRSILDLYKAGHIERWNPVSGCCYTCTYCWARRLALTKLRSIESYRRGFTPRLNERELRRRFKRAIVFVGFMGDMWADCVPDAWIRRVLEYLQQHDNGKHLFFFLTKNPARYKDYISQLPRYSFLGATIETNKDQLYVEARISNAPLPSQRYKALRDANWHWKNVTIEPIIDFDPLIMIDWIKQINPVLVFIDYNTLNQDLPEPPPEKTKQLIQILENRYFTIYKNTPRKTKH